MIATTNLGPGTAKKDAYDTVFGTGLEPLETLMELVCTGKSTGPIP